MTSDERRALYIKAIESCNAFEGKGKVIFYTSVNGHMFSQFSKEENVGIRLSKEERDAFIRKYNTELLVTYGTIMKEYVHVPENLLSDTALIKSLLESSFNYVKSLKPKPTTKKMKS